MAIIRKATKLARGKCTAVILPHEYVKYLEKDGKKVTEFIIREEDRKLVLEPIVS